jgi:hypothetical protein
MAKLAGAHRQIKGGSGHAKTKTMIHVHGTCRGNTSCAWGMQGRHGNKVNQRTAGGAWHAWGFNDSSGFYMAIALEKTQAR